MAEHNTGIPLEFSSYIDFKCDSSPVNTNILQDSWWKVENEDFQDLRPHQVRRCTAKPINCIFFIWEKHEKLWRKIGFKMVSLARVGP